MAQRLIPKIKFAELCGFTRGYATALSKNKLKDAITGNSIDLNHPCVVDYLKKKSEKGAVGGKKCGPKKKENKALPRVVIPKEYADYSDWTIRDVFSKFGSEYQFKEFLAASKIISAINLQELEMSKRKNELIERVLVERLVFKSFETLFLRILGASKKVSLKIHTLCNSGSEPEECEAEATKILSQLLKNSKAEIVKNMEMFV